MSVILIPEVAQLVLTSYRVPEMIDMVLNDLGYSIDGTGYLTRTDIMKALSSKGREIHRMTENLLVSLNPINTVAGQNYIELPVEILRIWSAYCDDGGGPKPLSVFTEDQLTEHDTNWKYRSGDPVAALMTDVAEAGKPIVYPVPTVNTNLLTLRVIKIGAKISAESSIAGDASKQVFGLFLYGTTSENTDDGLLYWDLTNATTTRTFTVYKNSDKTAGDRVCEGSLVGDGQIDIAEVNASGMTGKVTVAYTTDDTDAANIITLTPVEMPEDDVQTLQYGIQDNVLRLERAGKDLKKADMYLGLYKAGIDGIKKRIEKIRGSRYRTLKPRPIGYGTRLRPYYEWEL
jgi:hypothetical protein